MSFSGFIGIDDPRWGDVLAVCAHDFYHLPAYVALEARWTGAEPLAFVHSDGDMALVVALLERATPGGCGSDAVTPYGYSSPLWSAACDDAFRRRSLAAFQDAACARGLISTFMRLHPLLQPALDDIAADCGGRWAEIERGVTLLMPMDGDETAFLAGMARGHRAGVRRLREAGGRLALNTEQAWAAFGQIYRATMDKVGATSAYYYSDDYFADLRAGLGGAIHCAGVIDADGAMMCAGLFTHVGGVVQYHLSGTAEGFSRAAPMKLLLAEMRNWAVAQGAQAFHLGGGLGGTRDSLYAFKQQFGGEELAFRTVSVIHDAAAYEAECALVRAAAGQDAPPLAPGFFPLYRAPVRAVEAA